LHCIQFSIGIAPVPEKPKQGIGSELFLNPNDPSGQGNGVLLILMLILAVDVVLTVGVGVALVVVEKLTVGVALLE